MALAEIPHSVIVEANPHPDTTSLSRRSGGFQVLEPNGAHMKRTDVSVDRALILGNESDMSSSTSIIFRPTNELDTISFQRLGDPEKFYVAQNGSYVEFGVVRPQGRAGVQYDLEHGRRLMASVDVGAFENFQAPSNIDPEGIGLISDACMELRRHKITPAPEKLDRLRRFIGNVIQISVPQNAEQLPLAL